MSTDLEQRRDIAQAALARFRSQPFKPGKFDCVRLAAFVLRQRGHRPGLGRGGSYTSLLGAHRALQKAGFETLADALDALGLPRIPPAAALPCDIIMVPGEGPFDGALHVAVGNGRTIGYHQDLPGADVLQPIMFLGAWRV
ncbi:hypothetical protein ASE70_15080 [Sphingomonas sp. Leaf22]|uniref:DUF6950 family protein n=1 Tax=Sphingomonas sp. Leaf22 TaxID=1735687 RepID=UPI0006FA6370|nr:hypothetical protein [Sphingomonas sp. Leaf22]KQM92235.1 hypothetical protein ASE70_15080 [Sphingomonas sp. Leaf22]